MNYQDGFEALQNGEFARAAALLEKAAQETDFVSDIINHSCTLALYRAGEKARLADIAFRIGQSLVESDPASALDYFQRALTAGLDIQRARLIGQLFEQWAAAAPSPTSTAASPAEAPSRIAHVIGSVSRDHPTTAYLKTLVSALKASGVESTVFTTEWNASWFTNTAASAPPETVAMDAEVHVASLEGDFEQRAALVAESLRNSGITVAVFHANPAEQITLRVASLRPLPVQIQVVHGGDVPDLFDGYVHPFQNSLERNGSPAKPAQWIPPASTVHERLQAADPVTRESLGLESASSVTATFGHLDNVAGREYLRVITEILNRFPKHFHLFAGAGNVKSMRSFLHAEGVLPRVRFLGQVGDIAPLLDVVDVYLASFPRFDAASILDAMGAGRPVVALKQAPDLPANGAAELVGVPDLIGKGEAGYIEIVDRLLRNTALRSKFGRAMIERSVAEFRPEKLAERYKSFLRAVQRHDAPSSGGNVL